MQKSGSETLENSRKEDLGLYGLVIDIIKTWGNHLKEQGVSEEWSLSTLCREDHRFELFGIIFILFLHLFETGSCYVPELLILLLPPSNVRTQC